MSVKTWNELEQMHDKIAGVKYNMADLQSITVGFWEGGSNYWILLATVIHPILPNKPRGMATSEWAFDALLNGGSVEIKPNEIVKEKGEVYVLTMEKSKAGLKMFIEKNTRAKYNFVIAGVLDAGNVDSSDSDCILQYAIFQEGVFG